MITLKQIIAKIKEKEDRFFVKLEADIDEKIVLKFDKLKNGDFIEICGVQKEYENTLINLLKKYKDFNYRLEKRVSYLYIQLQLKNPSTKKVIDTRIMNINLKDKILEMVTESLKADEINNFHFEKAVKEIVRCYHKLRNKQEPNYQGYDLTESEMTACCHPLEYKLTLDNIEYEAEGDRGLLAVVIAAAMQLGMNQGLIMGKNKGKQKVLMELLNLKKE